MEDNYDDDPLGFLAEFKKGRYMSFSIDSSNLYLNEIPEGECSDGKSAPPSTHPHNKLQDNQVCLDVILQIDTITVLMYFDVTYKVRLFFLKKII